MSSKYKAVLTIHNADSPHGRRQLILWLERQAKFLKRNGPKKFAKRYTARLFVDADNVIFSERQHS